MTDNNRPHGGHEMPPLDASGEGSAEVAKQWWESPSTGSSGTAGADPTIVRGAPGQFASYPSQPYAQGAPYTPPPQPYAPQYAQQPPQYAQPAPPPAGPPGYPPPPYGSQYSGMPPRRQKSKTPWILGGIAAFVLVAALGGGLIVAAKGLGGGDKSWEGNYAMDKVTDSCKLVDVNILGQWAPNQKDVTHTENQPDSRWGGGSLNCRARNEGTGINDATLSMQADFASKYSSPSYKIWKDTATSTTGTGRASGPVSGLGEEAYFSSREDASSSFNTLDYTIGVLNSNLSIQLEISVYSKTPIDKSAVAAACEAQARKVMAGLRK